jgi:hypothetical protein
MKKQFIALMLICLTLPVFAQTDDPYAKFQGVWWLKETEDSAHYIFISNILTILLGKMNNNLLYYCTYSIGNSTITIDVKKIFNENNWISKPFVDAPDTIIEYQYVFSGSKLILIYEDQTMVFSKVTD